MEARRRAQAPSIFDDNEKCVRSFSSVLLYYVHRLEVGDLHAFVNGGHDVVVFIANCSCSSGFYIIHPLRRRKEARKSDPIRLHRRKTRRWDIVSIWSKYVCRQRNKSTVQGMNLNHDKGYHRSSLAAVFSRR